MAQYRSIGFLKVQEIAAARRYGALVRGDVRGLDGYFGETSIVVPMSSDPKADRRQQLWDSILVGVGVSLGTTLALRLLSKFFGGK